VDTLLPGITADRVPISRLTVAVLSVAGRGAPTADDTAPASGRTAPAVLFVHGNVSTPGLGAASGGLDHASVDHVVGAEVKNHSRPSAVG
jgi:hypothetical protein